MKTFIIVGAMVLVPFSFINAATDYYLKLGGVDGETTKAVYLDLQSGVIGQTFILDGTKSQDDGTINRFVWKQVSGPTTVKLSSTTVIKPSFPSTQVGTYVFELTVTDATGLSYVAQKSEVIVGASFKAESVDTPAPKPQEGKVETGWKVEEGTKATTPSIEPDEIDVNEDGEPLTPDFSILLGGGGGSEEERLKGLERAQQVILENAKASDQSIESISLNFEKITTRVRHEVKILGFIPVTTTAEVDIDAQEIVKVKFPWWTFLASGKDKDDISERVLENISEILKKTPKKESAGGNVEFEWKVEEGES